MQIRLPFIGDVNLRLPKALERLAPQAPKTEEVAPRQTTGHSTQDTFETPADPVRRGGLIRGYSSGGPTS